MNIPKSLVLQNLNIGKLYISEKKRIQKPTTYSLSIIKIQNVQLEPPKKYIYGKTICLRQYSVFSEIFDFHTTRFLSSSVYEFYENYLFFFNMMYFFYEFDENWFLQNKQIILQYIDIYSQTKKPFPNIFQEIESEKI
ncbi:MAG: hypothetical protein BWY04_01475 [candidate division CPR1 bacterium ADurb.Bin160]|uniref:Uncharacterized protein n=1 Tax=candidate division CPR1 bacterium ADurb.Bin160 TaxID=1852826 RepID=A0A1V5ZIV3_9BACT|nr:MAG: hypothetical protein BWY04_01475 [candidate division CPR1 bacterium ADurb.Bin160]